MKTTLAQLMVEFGSACRNDMNSIDGRDIAMAMEFFAKELEDFEDNVEYEETEAAELRIGLGLDPTHLGEWMD